MLPVRYLYVCAWYILKTYYVSAAYRNPNWQGLQFHFIHEALVSQLLEFSTFLHEHTRTHMHALTHTHMISQHQKRKHCAILCLFAGKIEAYYAATHASSSPRIVCQLQLRHERLGQRRSATHSLYTHTHLPIRSALLFGFKNWISPGTSFITLISRRHRHLTDQGFLPW